MEGGKITSQALQKESRGIFQPGPGAVPGRPQCQPASGQESCSLEHSWFFHQAPPGPEWLTEEPLSPSLLPSSPAKSPGCDFSVGSGFQGLLGLEPGMKTLETLRPPPTACPSHSPHLSLILSLPKALMTPSGEKTEAQEGQASCPTTHS